MDYTTFKETVRAGLLAHPDGMTWPELKTRLRLPYARPCPEWTRRLEQDIHLVRRKGAGQALVWSIRFVPG
jgi:hypothetical protein